MCLPWHLLYEGTFYDQTISLLLCLISGFYLVSTSNMFYNSGDINVTTEPSSAAFHFTPLSCSLWPANSSIVYSIKNLFSYLSPITLLKEPIHYLSDTKRHFACFCLFMNKVIWTIVAPCVTTTRVQGLQHVSSFYILFHANSFFIMRGRNNEAGTGQKL